MTDFRYDLKSHLQVVMKKRCVSSIKCRECKKSLIGNISHFVLM